MPSAKLAVYRPFMEYESAEVATAFVAFARAAPPTGFVADFGRVPFADATLYLNALADK